MTAEAPVLHDVRPLVDSLLTDAIRQTASDIHVEPAADGYELRFRIDGILETNRKLDPAIGRAVVARLMVMARLLTYRMDVPQEGRISLPISADNPPWNCACRVMPTIHGMRAAVRMPAEHIQPAILEDLNLPAPVLDGLLAFAAADGGMLILTGPAGSGKTTTMYALLRQIARQNPGVSIIALEDPVERDVPGVTQIEVSPFGQLTYERALRSILRQDPQVLMLGEVRDAATASLAVQAALSGHRLITALHAATPAGAADPPTRNGHRALPTHQQHSRHRRPTPHPPKISRWPRLPRPSSAGRIRRHGCRTPKSRSAAGRCQCADSRIQRPTRISIPARGWPNSCARGDYR